MRHTNQTDNRKTMLENAGRTNICKKKNKNKNKIIYIFVTKRKQSHTQPYNLKAGFLYTILHDQYILVFRHYFQNARMAPIFYLSKKKSQ